MADIEKVRSLILIACEGGELNLRQVVNSVSEGTGISDRVVIQTAYTLEEEGLVLLEDPAPPRTLNQYLGSGYSIWFWSTIAAVILTLLAVYALPQTPPLLYARYVLGVAFVLFLPGFTVVEALYPGREGLSSTEKLAFSVGASIAIVPLVTLILNYTRWGIRLLPTLAALSLLVVSLSIVAAYRMTTQMNQVELAEVPNA